MYSLFFRDMESSNNSLEFDNSTPPLTEIEFLQMIEKYKHRNNYNDDGIERKDRMNFDPRQGLEGLLGNEIEGHYNELGSGYINGNSNNGTYKVITQNEADEEVPYFVKFVGNSQKLKRFKTGDRGYDMQCINAHGDLARYMQDYSSYEMALENIKNKESITEDASKVINFIKKAITDGVFYAHNGEIKFNTECDEKELKETIKKGYELNLLSFDIDQGKRTSSKDYRYNCDGVYRFNTMASAHWQNILSQVFNEKDPWKFSHGGKNYEMAFTPISKITTNNGKVFITKGANKEVWNEAYNSNVLQTDIGNIVKVDVFDPEKIFAICGLSDMHYGNVGSEYDQISKTWKIDAFDIGHENHTIEWIKQENKNGKFNNALNSFYSKLFSKESIEKICNYLKDKNMKHETKSYMNDILKELNDVKRYLETKKIIKTNGIQFPENLDDAKKMACNLELKKNKLIQEQNALKEKMKKMELAFTKYFKVCNNNYDPYKQTNAHFDTSKKPIKVSEVKVTPQTNLATTQYGKFR